MNNQEFLDLYNELDSLLRDIYDIDDNSQSAIMKKINELKQSSRSDKQSRAMMLDSARNIRNFLVHNTKKGVTFIEVSNELIYFIKKDKKQCNNCGRILEITKNERTKGDLGFWWCGRFGMHNWKMDINEKNINLDKYKNIIIVTPIWVFKMASPIRGFVDFYKEKLSTKNITVIFNHFNPWLPKGAIKEMKNYIPVNNIESKTTMLGHIFK